jgi:hypothetical protein
MEILVRRQVRIPTVRYGHEEIDIAVRLSDEDFPDSSTKELLDSASRDVNRAVDAAMDRVYQELENPSQ